MLGGWTHCHAGIDIIVLEVVDLLRIRSTVMSGLGRQINGEKNWHTQLDYGAEDDRGGDCFS